MNKSGSGWVWLQKLLRQTWDVFVFTFIKQRKDVVLIGS